MPKDVKVPNSIARHWDIDHSRIMQARYKYGGQPIFKFCYDPVCTELLFDIPGFEHYTIILNNSKRQFNDFVRGICFWNLKVVYLRWHSRQDWLQATMMMLRKNGIPGSYRIIWGEKAAFELRDRLKGL